MKLKSILALLCTVSLVTCTSCGDDEPDSRKSHLGMSDRIGGDIKKAEVKNDYKIIDFTGMDYNIAVSKYGNSIKFVVEGYEYSSYDENTIIWQSIEPGTEYKKGDTLKVKISKGHDTVEVPDLRDINQALAVDQLKMRDLKPEIINQSDPDIKENNVIKTEPGAGEQVQKGSNVIVYVSTGVSMEGEIPFRINFPVDANGRFAVELIIVDEDGNTSTISTTSIPVPETSFWEQDIKGSGENVLVTVMLINKETDAKAEIGRYNFNFETGVVTPQSEDVKGAFEQVGGVTKSD